MIQAQAAPRPSSLVYAALGLSALSLTEVVEGQVQVQDVDAGLAKHAGESRAGVLAHETLHHVRAQAARFSDACDLELRVGWANLRVEAAARGGNHSRRHLLRRGARVLFEHLVQRVPDVVDELAVGRAEVGAARVGSVVAPGAGIRRSGMEVARLGEALADQLRADYLPAAHDEAAIGLPGEGSLRDYIDRERIDDAGHHRQRYHHRDRGKQRAHVSLPYARCRAATSKSIALMPMNGMSTPPRP